MEIERNIITRNFTKGRPGWNGAPFVVIHTYGAKGTNLYPWFQTNDVSVSAHFSIEKSGKIRQYVEIDDTAWANGTAFSNANGVSVEFQDDGDYNNPNTYTQAQIDSFAWLFVNVINPWASGRIANNEAGITPHNKWTPKECPGKLWDRRGELYAAIDKLLKPLPPVNTEIEELKKEVINLKTINLQLKEQVTVISGKLETSELAMKDLENKLNTAQVELANEKVLTDELLDDQLRLNTENDNLRDKLATAIPQEEADKFKKSIWYTLFNIFNK